MPLRYPNIPVAKEIYLLVECQGWVESVWYKNSCIVNGMKTWCPQMLVVSHEMKDKIVIDGVIEECRGQCCIFSSYI